MRFSRAAVFLLTSYLSNRADAILFEGTGEGSPTSPEDGLEGPELPADPACGGIACAGTFSSLEDKWGDANDYDDSIPTTICVCSGATIDFENQLDPSQLNIDLRCAGGANCVFDWNGDGSGDDHFFYNENGQAKFSIKGFKFVNAPKRDIFIEDGGIYNIDQCEFVGGGVVVSNPDEDSSVTITDSKFTDKDGNAALNVGAKDVRLAMVVDGCTFENNDGGAIQYSGEGGDDDTMTVTSCTFSGNTPFNIRDQFDNVIECDTASSGAPGDEFGEFPESEGPPTSGPGNVFVNGVNEPSDLCA